MDFGLTDEQRSDRRDDAGVRRARALPARGGGRAHRRAAARARRARSARRRSAAGLYAANMPEEVGGAGLDTVTWVLYEKELGRANYALHYPASGGPPTSCWPAPRRSRSSYLYPSVRGETRRLPGDDRARRRAPTCAACAPGRSATAERLADQGHQALHQPRRRVRLRDPVRASPTTGRRGGARRCRRSWSTSTPRAWRCTTATATSRTAATPTRSSTSTTAGCPTTRCSARRARASTWPAPGSAAPGSRWRPPASAGPSGRSTSPYAHAAEPRAVRPEDRPLPGHLLQARRHGDRAAGRRAADAGGRLEVRPGHRHRRRHRDGQAQGHRDAGDGGRRGDPDPRRHGPDGRAAAGADLARRPHRADLGRHLGDPAAHHLPGAAASAGSRDR